MRVRGILALVGVVASLTTVGTVGMSTMSASPAAATLPDVTVTIIDTGVAVTHQESIRSARPTTRSAPLWDTATNGGEPWDNHGHGTATASAAVGLNAASSTSKRPSFCPGCKLAVATVGNAAGGVSLSEIAYRTALPRTLAQFSALKPGLTSDESLNRFGRSAVTDRADATRAARRARHAPDVGLDRIADGVSRGCVSRRF